MRVRFSCVVDRDPKFAYQAWIWCTTLLRIAGRQPGELVVHAVHGADGPRLDALRAAGVEVRPIPVFDERHPHSNKLGQLASDAFDHVDRIVLTDCDIAFANDLRDLLAGAEMVAAKRVDTGQPSHECWKHIFAAAGFADEPRLGLSTHTREPTFEHNFNGGVYVIRPQALDALRDAWPRWNTWLLDRPHLLGELQFYTDQVSFGLATYELGLSVRELSATYNCPVQHRNSPLTDPVVLHYHDRVDASGLMELSGSPAVDRKIRRVNRVLAEAQRVAPAQPARWRH